MGTTWCNWSFMAKMSQFCLMCLKWTSKYSIMLCSNMNGRSIFQLVSDLVFSWQFGAVSTCHLPWKRVQHMSRRRLGLLIGIWIWMLKDGTFENFFAEWRNATPGDGVERSATEVVQLQLKALQENNPENDEAWWEQRYTLQLFVHFLSLGCLDFFTLKVFNFQRATEARMELQRPLTLLPAETRQLQDHYLDSLTWSTLVIPCC